MQKGLGSGPVGYGMNPPKMQLQPDFLRPGRNGNCTEQGPKTVLKSTVNPNSWLGTYDSLVFSRE